jgi:acyl carrier protein
MTTQLEFRQALRDWIVEHSVGLGEEDLRDDTPFLERRLITSVQTLDLVLFLEQLCGRSLDLSRLQPGSFRDIDTLCRLFWMPS